MAKPGDEAVSDGLASAPPAIPQRRTAARPRHLSIEQRLRWVGFLFVLPALLHLALFKFYPMAQALLLSLLRYDLLRPPPAAAPPLPPCVPAGRGRPARGGGGGGCRPAHKTPPFPPPPPAPRGRTQ